MKETMKATRPINWDARIGLALSILTWRDRSALAGILATRALQGWSIEQLMMFERGVRDIPNEAA